MSKAKKDAEKLLKWIEFELSPPQPKKRLKIIRTPYTKGTKKDRRHSGHKIVYYEDNEGYATQFDTYDEWNNYRDGLRDRSNMKKNIYPRMSFYNEELYLRLKAMNKFMKKHESIRRIRKNKLRQKMKAANKELLLSYS